MIIFLIDLLQPVGSFYFNQIVTLYIQLPFPRNVINKKGVCGIFNLIIFAKAIFHLYYIVKRAFKINWG